MYHDNILTTYRHRFKELVHEKQFHLLTRLALWNHDAWSIQQLPLQKEAFLGGTTQAEWHKKMTDIQNRTPDYTQVNHGSARKTYFEAYPNLYGLELAMFQALHARHHFDADLTACLPEPESIQRLIDQLLSDPQTLGALSTYAIDIFYLYNRFLQSDDTALIPIALLKESCEKSPSVQLAIYLITHCVIGETLFYNRKIPLQHQAYYHNLITELNNLAETNWQDLTLDNRLEVALCNQITNTPSSLVDKAVIDADSYFSQEYGFIIDPKKPNKNTLAGSEHRNVLYLMVVGYSR